MIFDFRFSIFDWMVSRNEEIISPYEDLSVGGTRLDDAVLFQTIEELFVAETEQS